jgi:hypothetical protein
VPNLSITIRTFFIAVGGAAAAVGQRRRQQARAKNRRLAHMVQLESKGYFSEETMRRR